MVSIMTMITTTTTSKTESAVATSMTNIATVVAPRQNFATFRFVVTVDTAYTKALLIFFSSVVIVVNS